MKNILHQILYLILRSAYQPQFKKHILAPILQTNYPVIRRKYFRKMEHSQEVYPDVLGHRDLGELEFRY
jgi:hypothetical protein